MVWDAIRGYGGLINRNEEDTTTSMKQRVKGVQVLGPSSNTPPGARPAPLNDPTHPS
jgi:hypothetical protein